MIIPKTGVAYLWAAQRYVLLSAGSVPLEARAAALDRDQARWTLGGLRQRRGELIALLSETGETFAWRRLDDNALLRHVAGRIAAARLLVLREEALAGGSERSHLVPSAETSIVRAVMDGEREIRFQDQYLVLMEVGSWPWLRDEMDLQVIPRDKAVTLLDELASGSSSPVNRKKAIGDAKTLLVDRIRPGTTKGLVLARRAPGRSYQAIPEEVAAAAPRPRTAPAEEPPPLTMVLQHLYHDDGPIQGADYELTFPGGQVIKGKLDAGGMATVNDVPAESAEVVYGPDSRDYKPVEQSKSPSFKQTLSPAQSAAIAEKYWRQSSDDDGADAGAAGDASADGGDEA